MNFFFWRPKFTMSKKFVKKFSQMQNSPSLRKSSFRGITVLVSQTWLNHQAVRKIALTSFHYLKITPLVNINVLYQRIINNDSKLWKLLSFKFVFKDLLFRVKGRHGFLSWSCPSWEYPGEICPGIVRAKEKTRNSLVINLTFFKENFCPDFKINIWKTFVSPHLEMGAIPYIYSNKKTAQAKIDKFIKQSIKMCLNFPAKGDDKYLGYLFPNTWKERCLHIKTLSYQMEN